MSSVPTLSKELRELEKRAVLLRNEVASLEATKRDVIFSESTKNQSEEIQRKIQGEQTQDANSRDQEQPRSVDRLSRGSNLNLLFPGLADQLSRKIGDVQCSIKEHRELQVEKERLTSLLTSFGYDIERMEGEYNEMMRQNSLSSNGATEPVELAQQQDERSSELQELVEMYRERQLLEGQLNHQSDELWHLSTLLQDTLNAKKQKEDALSSLKAATDTLQELRAKRVQLEHAVTAKEALIEKKIICRPEEERLVSANTDFDVAHRALEREDGLIKRNDAAIRHRAMQIAKTQKRLTLIGEAVAGDESDGEESVDAELADRLVLDIEALHEVYAGASVHMNKLDREIEKMEYKMGAINRAILGAKKELKLINEGHRRKIRLIRKEVAHEQKVNKINAAILESELEELRKVGANKQRCSKGRRNAKTH